MRAREKPIEQVFGENLGYFLGQSQRQQKELAQHLGMTESSISQWLKGTSFPRFDKVDKICSFLGITRAQLVSERTPGLHAIRMTDQDMDYYVRYDLLSITGKQKASEYLDFLLSNPDNKKESKLQA